MFNEVNRISKNFIPRLDNFSALVLEDCFIGLSVSYTNDLSNNYIITNERKYLEVFTITLCRCKPCFIIPLRIRCSYDQVNIAYYLFFSIEL